MDGIHDLGGMHGFGPVVREPDEPVFHHDWERRVFGLNFSSIPHNVDQFRHAIEQMGPREYLGSSYYERWRHAIEHDAIAGGVITSESIESWIERIQRDGLDAVPRRLDPEAAIGMVRAVTTPRPPPVLDAVGRFATGDHVRVTRTSKPGHTRCPRYVRGAIGRVERALGVHPLPDAGAVGEEFAEPLYSVAFAAEELWGNGDHVVFVDVWESYLEPGGDNGI
jgi:nitrile hydratase subunit beta